MMKRLLVVILLLALFIGVIPAAAQTDMGDAVFGVTITQERLNELAQQAPLGFQDFTWITFLHDGEIEITATVERGDREVNLIVIVTATATEDGLVWNAVDWETQPALDDTDGNERIQRVVTTTTNILDRLIRQEVRSVYDASSPYLALSAVISEGEMTIEFAEVDQERTLPPNVTDNNDGTYTV
ncbi:MAG: hypothetical protein KC546_22300, partial [Anaerolineae bacterium]|nr:hypothetical protein [Anaerolineae bacterium]